MLHHPDDEEFYSGTWADQHATYEDACAYYGADTPAQMAAETAAEQADWHTQEQDNMEARGGPVFRVSHTDDIPF
jgi:hypothetical protein